MREVVFDSLFIEDHAYWIRTHPRTALRLLDLVQAVARDAFTGIGKPEPLRGMGPNHWSRRLTDEHRILYRVEERAVRFLRSRGHY